jgi:hypothetical protein
VNVLTLDAVECLFLGATLEGVPAGEQDPQNDPTTPNITLLRVQSLQDLRRHVRQCTDLSPVPVVMGELELKGLTKIDELDLDVLFSGLGVNLLDEDDVFELDVSMCDFKRMHVTQSTQQLLDDSLDN